MDTNSVINKALEAVADIAALAGKMCNKNRWIEADEELSGTGADYRGN